MITIGGLHDVQEAHVYLRMSFRLVLDCQLSHIIYVAYVAYTCQLTVSSDRNKANFNRQRVENHQVASHKQHS